MPIKLPQSVKTLLQDKAYGHVITFNAVGQPQTTMVWMDVDGDEVTFNTAEGRLKPKNIRNDPRVIVSVQSSKDPAGLRHLLRQGPDYRRGRRRQYRQAREAVHGRRQDIRYRRAGRKAAPRAHQRRSDRRRRPRVSALVVAPERVPGA